MVECVPVDSWGNFKLYKTVIYTKKYETDTGYVRNTKTGERCGKIVYVSKGEDDCYEIVEED